MFSLIAYRANPRDGRNAKLTIGQAELRRTLYLSEASVRRALRTLIGLGLVTRRIDGDGRRSYTREGQLPDWLRMRDDGKPYFHKFIPQAKTGVALTDWRVYLWLLNKAAELNKPEVQWFQRGVASSLCLERRTVIRSLTRLQTNGLLRQDRNTYTLIHPTRQQPQPTVADEATTVSEPKVSDAPSRYEYDYRPLLADLWEGETELIGRMIAVQRDGDKQPAIKSANQWGELIGYAAGYRSQGKDIRGRRSKLTRAVEAVERFDLASPDELHTVCCDSMRW